MDGGAPDQLLTCSLDGSVRAWDLRSGQQTQQCVPAAFQPIVSMYIPPCGRLLACVRDFQTVWLESARPQLNHWQFESLHASCPS